MVNYCISCNIYNTLFRDIRLCYERSYRPYASKTGYYNWLDEPVSPRYFRINKLDAVIEDVFNEHKSRCGFTRMFVELKSRNGKIEIDNNAAEKL